MQVATALHLFAYCVRAHNKKCARLVRCLRQARCCHEVVMRALHIERRHDAGQQKHLQSTQRRERGAGTSTCPLP